MQRVGQTFSNQFFNFILALNAAMAMMNRGGSREQMKKRPTATHAARSPSESQRLGTESRARTVRSGCTRGAWWIHLCWMQAHMVQPSFLQQDWIQDALYSRQVCTKTSKHSSIHPREPTWPMCLQKDKFIPITSQILHHYSGK